MLLHNLITVAVSVFNLLSVFYLFVILQRSTITLLLYFLLDRLQVNDMPPSNLWSSEEDHRDVSAEIKSCKGIITLHHRVTIKKVLLLMFDGFYHREM